MVITTSTQWRSPPFVSSSFNTGGGGGGGTPLAVCASPPRRSAKSALSPSCTPTCKPGSVLGLRSCSTLSKPTLSSIAHLDLHTHSLSRRFIEAIVSDSSPGSSFLTTKTRSAGSFRLDESFPAWISDDRGIDMHFKEKPICAMPLRPANKAPVTHARYSFEERAEMQLCSCSTDAPAVCKKDGKDQIEGKFTYIEPHSAIRDNHVIPGRANKANSGGKPIFTMARSSIVDATAVAIRDGKWCSDEEIPTSGKSFSTSNEVLGRASSVNKEGKPISSFLCSSPGAASTALIRAGGFNVDLEGDITAADVDLLPMPGLVSLASPLYDSYLSVSPSDSRLTRISSSDHLSTANSSNKPASKFTSNYLGLPPEFLQEVDGKLMCCKIPAASNEEDLGCPNRRGSAPQMETSPDDPDKFAGSNLTNTSSNYAAAEDDDFAESHSLAGLWSNHDEIECDAQTILHGSEGLAASGKNQMEVGAGALSCCEDLDVESCIGSQFVMDELEYLMMRPRKADAATSVRAADMSHDGAEEGGISTSNEALVIGGHSFKLESQEMYAERRPNVNLIKSPYPDFEGQGGSSALTGAGGSCQSLPGPSMVSARRMPLLSASPGDNVASQCLVNGNQSLCAASMAVNINHRSYITNYGSASMMIGKKRPLPVSDHLQSSLIPPYPGMITNSGTILQQGNPDSKASEMSYTSAKQALSAMLYKAQGGGAPHARFSWAASEVSDGGEAMIKSPPSKARRRHGTAMDPQSIAARTRREKFSDRIRILQSLVPNGDRLDTVSMLGQTLEYVRFLQHQVWQLYHGMDPSSNIKSEKWKDFLDAAQPSPTS